VYQTEKEKAVQTEKMEHLSPDNPHDKGNKWINFYKKEISGFYKLIL